MKTEATIRRRAASRGKTRRRVARPVADAYLALVRAFPLRPIRDEAEYEAAAAVADTLAVRPEVSLSAGEHDYLDTLALLIQTYDDAKIGTAAGKLGGVDALKYLMEQTGMRRMDLGDLLGNRALATFILNGQRDMSKAHIRTLAKHFKVDASLFLDAD